MRRISGMTLIELMMVMAIIALLVAVALPSYQRYLARGIRSQGQQFLMDLAQAQEQFFLDQRSYATGLASIPTAGLLTRSIPDTVAQHYTLVQPFNVNNVASPPTFTLVLTPLAADKSVGAAASTPDGSLIINNLQQRWRSVQITVAYTVGIDCTWEDATCVSH
jgi:type IV pilus assembly protein PilE